MTDMPAQDDLFWDNLSALTSELNERISAHVARNGFRDGRSVGDVIALLHSEASEILEEYRSGHGPEEIYYTATDDIQCYYDDGQYFSCKKGDAVSELRGLELIDEFGIVEKLKPEGMMIELADLTIRVLDNASEWNGDLIDCIRRKQAFNETRAFKHGKVM